MNKFNEIKFVADVMLGKLRRYLVICGYDCVYRKKFPDKKLVRFARREDRVLLTRDTHMVETLVKNDKVSLLKETDLQAQLTRLKNDYQLVFKPERLFSRCLDCNRPLRSVSKEAVKGDVPDETYEWLYNYYRCPECESVYWRGSHYRAIKRRLKEWNLLDAD